MCWWPLSLDYNTCKVKQGWRES